MIKKRKIIIGLLLGIFHVVVGSGVITLGIIINKDMARWGISPDVVASLVVPGMLAIYISFGAISIYEALKILWCLNRRKKIKEYYWLKKQLNVMHNKISKRVADTREKLDQKFAEVESVMQKRDESSKELEVAKENHFLMSDDLLKIHTEHDKIVFEKNQAEKELERCKKISRDESESLVAVRHELNRIQEQVKRLEPDLASTAAQFTELTSCHPHDLLRHAI